MLPNQVALRQDEAGVAMPLREGWAGRSQAPELRATPIRGPSSPHRQQLTTSLENLQLLPGLVWLCRGLKLMSEKLSPAV